MCRVHGELRAAVMISWECPFFAVDDAMDERKKGGWGRNRKTRTVLVQTSVVALVATKSGE